MRHDAIDFFGLDVPTHKKPIIAATAVIGWNSLIDCQAQVTIEDYVFFGHRVMILTGLHDYQKRNLERQHAVDCLPVMIKEGAWIASGVIILPGVTIGEHAVIGAGSVVTHDIPANTLAAGNPARIIRSI